MRKPIILALSISAILISGSLYDRLNSKSSSSDNLQAVQQNRPAVDVSVFNGSSNGVATSSEGVTSQDQITMTDMVSRQLLSNLISLNNSGNASVENIHKVAEAYANTLTQQTTITPTTLSDLTIISDTNQNTATYIKKVFSLRTLAQDKSSGDNANLSLTGVLDPKFSGVMLEMSKIYSELAYQLKSLPVPTSLAENHVKLINNYLSSSQATRAMSSVETDPINSLTAIYTQANNSNEEELLISNIRNSAIRVGIDPNSL